MSEEKRKRKPRSDKKWTREIEEWAESMVPARDHGFNSRREFLDALNKRFETDFSMNAFVTHMYESGIQLGLAFSNSNVPRGEKHWRHRPVGSFQEKKGYVRIKVAEPNVWRQYQRYVWEKAHPGESAEGMAVIFMDGDTRNFDPANLERVSRAELSVMSTLGNRAGLAADERRTILLKARLKILRTERLGKENAQRMRNKKNYERRKRSPEWLAAQKAYAKAYWQKCKADPVKHQKVLERNRRSRKRHEKI